MAMQLQQYTDAWVVVFTQWHSKEPEDLDFRLGLGEEMCIGEVQKVPHHLSSDQRQQGENQLFQDNQNKYTSELGPRSHKKGLLNSFQSPHT